MKRKARLVAVTLLAFVIAAASPVLAQQATVVGVDAVRAEPLSQTVPVLGRLVAPDSGNVSAALAGSVSKVLVNVGDHVKKGDVLVELDTRVKRAEARVIRSQLDQALAVLKSAKAQITLAEQELARQSQLKKSGAFARSKYETAGQELIKAQAALIRDQAIIATRQASLDVIELDIARSSIRAPYDAVVVEKMVSPGSFLRVGDTLVKLLSDKGLEIEADVPSVRLSGLVVGAKVNAELEDGFRFVAKVRSRLPVENPMTRTRPVRFSVDWPDGILGLADAQAVSVFVPVGASRQVVTVHKDAIIRKGDGSHVFVVANGKAAERKVQLGEATGSRIVVENGLEVGDLAVVRGNERLRSGAAVKVNQGS